MDGSLSGQFFKGDVCDFGPSALGNPLVNMEMHRLNCPKQSGALGTQLTASPAISVSLLSKYDLNQRLLINADTVTGWMICGAERGVEQRMGWVGIGVLALQYGCTSMTACSPKTGLPCRVLGQGVHQRFHSTILSGTPGPSSRPQVMGVI